jgi:hypothetical protein
MTMGNLSQSEQIFIPFHEGLTFSITVIFAAALDIFSSMRLLDPAAEAICRKMSRLSKAFLPSDWHGVIGS